LELLAFLLVIREAKELALLVLGAVSADLVMRPEVLVIILVVVVQERQLQIMRQIGLAVTVVMD